MHELPIIESVLSIVLNSAEKNDVRQIMVINLQIGKLSDLEDEWIQRYFEYLSKGTIAQGAKLNIEHMPIMLQCNICSTSYEVEITTMGDAVCPRCGKKDSILISGREYTIKNMEVL